MKYQSTSKEYFTDLAGAVRCCYAPDRSLYMPERIPVIPRAFYNNVHEMTLKEIAYAVVTSLMGEDVNAPIIKKVVDETFTDLTFKSLGGRDEYVLELFTENSQTFKSIGARFMANFLSLSTDSALPRVAIAATTGNTGIAMAEAFSKQRERHLVVLYPKGALQHEEALQLCSDDSMLHFVEVQGDIDKCKQMVSDASTDKRLNEQMSMVCVNTSNFLRIVPQVVLFFYAYSRLKASGKKSERFVPVIPCGNLSMLVAAIIAKRLGLPIAEIVAATNANDGFVRIINGAAIEPIANEGVRHTLARAMDTGMPTNIDRVLWLYGKDLREASTDIKAVSITDNEILRAMKEWADKGYVADPHTAVALAAMERVAVNSSAPRVVFATSDPRCSAALVERATGVSVDGNRIKSDCSYARMHYSKIAPTYAALKKFLINTIKK